MKNYTLLKIVNILFFSCILISCGDQKAKSVEGYISEANTAMNGGDFVKAYEIVDILNSTEKEAGLFESRDDSYKKAAKDLNIKIVKNEIAYLFEEEGDSPLLGSKINKILRERLDVEKNEKDFLDILNMNIEIASDLGREDLVLSFLSQYPFKGQKIEGLQSSFTVKFESPYLKNCVEYNKLCDVALQKALNKKQFELAENIIAMYKDDPVTIQGQEEYDNYGNTIKTTIINGVKVDEHHCYVKYNWDSKTAAQKKLNEAKKNN